MITGTGIDITEIECIKASIEQNKRFVSKVFTPYEIDYCESKPFKYQHYAGRFAAKEAMMKALGSGWNYGISWKQIEVLNNSNGKPEIVLHKKAKSLFGELGMKNVHVSISHSDMYAVAVVVVEGEEMSCEL